jgi:PPOX class probable F420-dependent enzyme
MLPVGSSLTAHVEAILSDRAGVVAIPTEVRQLLDAPNYVHLSTLRADGSPRGWVVWVGLEGDRLLICTDDSTWKAKDMRRDPRIALSVVDSTNPYRMAAIQGRVVEVRPDPEGSFMDPIAMKYTRDPFPYRGPGRVCFVIEVIRAGTRFLDWLSHKPLSADGGA